MFFTVTWKIINNNTANASRIVVKCATHCVTKLYEKYRLGYTLRLAYKTRDATTCAWRQITEKSITRVCFANMQIWSNTCNHEMAQFLQFMKRMLPCPNMHPEGNFCFQFNLVIVKLHHWIKADNKV